LMKVRPQPVQYAQNIPATVIHQYCNILGHSVNLQFATNNQENVEPRFSALDISADHTGMMEMKNPTPNPAITREQSIHAAFIADAWSSSSIHVQCAVWYTGVTYHERTAQNDPQASTQNPLDAAILVRNVPAPKTTNCATEVVYCNNTAFFQWLGYRAIFSNFHESL